MAEERDPLDTTGQRQPENSIRPSKRRVREAPATAAPSDESSSRRPKPPPQAARPGASGDETDRSVPEHIRQRFARVGDHYYFPDGARAFTDRGRRLTTASENAEVIKSLIVIAEARGWREITVRGTERFRKEAWAQATAAGLTLQGYRPSEFERAQLARNLAREAGRASQPSPEAEPEPSEGAPFRVAEPRAARDTRDSFLTGRLIDHGVAAYRHDPHESISYFVKIDTGDGERDIWGVDLKRALQESLTRPQIGDEIGLRAVRKDAVTVQTPKRDAAGKAIGQQSLDTYRNHWTIERQEFFEQREAAARTLRDVTIDPKQAARRHPELVGTYLHMHAAEIAARRLRDPQDQQKFVTLVRAALADAVARGEPLPPVRLRERAAQASEPPARQAPEREEAPSRG
jgi:hypothetical protein